MSFFTQEQIDQLRENGKPKNHGKDHTPVVRFFLNPTRAVLLVTEIRSLEPLMVYGLCDFDADFCKLSHLELEKIASGCELKSDAKFQGKYPVSVYTDFAKRRRTLSLVKSVVKRLNAD